MLTLGCDPDLHDLAFASWSPEGPHKAWVLHVPRRKGVIEQAAVLEMMEALEDFDYIVNIFGREVCALAVEAQTLKRTGPKQHKRPQDIVTLGNVAGLALAHMRRNWPHAGIAFPAPETWKGQIPKAVMQARLYDELDWGYDMIGKERAYARPIRVSESFKHISEGQWKHIGDALLLARWAYTKLP